MQLVIQGARLDVFERFRHALMRDPDRLAQYNVLEQRFDGQPMAYDRAAKAAFITGNLQP